VLVVRKPRLAINVRSFARQNSLTATTYEDNGTEFGTGMPKRAVGARRFFRRVDY